MIERDELEAQLADRLMTMFKGDLVVEAVLRVRFDSPEGLSCWREFARFLLDSTADLLQARIESTTGSVTP